MCENAFGGPNPGFLPGSVFDETRRVTSIVTSGYR